MIERVRVWWHRWQRRGERPFDWAEQCPELLTRAPYVRLVASYRPPTIGGAR